MFEAPIKLKDCLLSEAIGDICGSPWEFAPYKQITLEGFRKSLEFDYKKEIPFDKTPLFENFNVNRPNRLPHPPYATDDTICTFALAEAVLNAEPGAENHHLKENLVKRCSQYINIGYGGMFRSWLLNPNREPYNSYGNGSAMRVSIAGWYPDKISGFGDKIGVVELADSTSNITHNHPQGIIGARAAAKAIFRARKGWNKDDVADGILEDYPNDWRYMLWSDIIDSYKFDVTCQGTLPVVAMALKESHDFESCIFKCVQSGGDSDTLGAITGPIAYACYREIPKWMLNLAYKYLPKWCLDVNEKFNKLNGF